MVFWALEELEPGLVVGWIIVSSTTLAQCEVEPAFDFGALCPSLSSVGTVKGVLDVQRQ